MKKLAVFLLLFSLFAFKDVKAQCGACKYKTGNLVVNGDFELGNIGFSSDYLVSTNLFPEGNYAVGSNANTYHSNFSGTDHGSGTGKFMIINGAPNPGTKAWCQTIVVLPNTDYNFSTWVSSVHPSNPALLQFSINGVQIGDIFQAPGTTFTWQEFFVNWNSGSAVTATICIENQSTIRSGNDFGIDDISFAPCLDYTIANRPQAGLDTVICSGQNLQLGIPGSTGFDISWSPDSMFSDPNALVQNLQLENLTDTPITYTFTLTSDSAGLGCIYSEDIVIQVNPQPSLDLGADTAICGGPITLSPNLIPGSIVNWSNGSTQETIDVSQSGTYQLNVDLFGCTVSDEIEITIDTIPTFDLGQDLSFCAGDSVLVSSPIAGLWNDGSSSNSRYSKNSEQLIFTSVNGTCSHSDTVETQMLSMPQVDLGNDTALCEGPLTITPNFTAGSLLAWSDGSSGNSLTVSESGTYTLLVDLLGCQNSDSIIITIDTIPTFALGQDLSFCEGDSVLVTSPIPGIWNDGSSANSRYSKNSEQLIFTSVNGTCSHSDTIETQMLSMPQVDLGNDTALCEGPLTITPNFTAGSLLTWSDGSSGNSLTVSESGTYTLLVDLLGCQNSDSIIITIDTIPTFALGQDLSFCEGDSALVSSPIPGIWNDGSNDNTRYSKNSEQLVFTSVNGTCSHSDTLETEAFAYPQFDLGKDTTLCNQTQYELRQDLGGLWNGIDPSPSIMLTQDSTLSLVVQNGPCEATDQISVAFHSIFPPELPDDTTICASNLVDVNIDLLPGESCIWSDGVSDNYRSLGLPGSYWVEKYTPTCSTRDSMRLDTVSDIINSLPTDLVTCETAHISYTYPLAPNESIVWDNGSTNPTITLSESKAYRATISNGYCQITDSIINSVDSFPVANLPPVATICDDQAITLAVTPELPYLYLWENGMQGAQITAQNPGSYAVSVINGACTKNLATTVDQLSISAPNLPDTVMSCFGDPVNINAAEAGVWPDGSFGQNYSTQEEGWHVLTIASGACAKLDSTYVFYRTLPTPEFFPLPICVGDQRSTPFSKDFSSLGFHWLDNGDSSMTRTFPDSTAKYYYQYQDGLCEIQGFVNVSVVPKPNILIPDSIKICKGESYSLEAQIPVGYSYEWDNGERFNPIRVISEPGTFTISAWNNACTATDTCVIMVDSLPQLPNLRDSICDGNNKSYALPVFQGFDVSWSNGNNNDTTVSSTAYLPFTISNEVCDTSVAYFVNGISEPQVDVADSLRYCVEEHPVITANINSPQPYTVAWNGVDGSNSYQSHGTENIQLRVSHKFCSVDKTVSVIKDSLILPTLDNAIAFCEGDSYGFTVNVDPSVQFAWSDGHPELNRIFYQNQALSLSFTQNSCSATQDISVESIPYPTINLDTAYRLCKSGSVEIIPSLNHYDFWEWENLRNQQSSFFYGQELTLVAKNRFCESRANTVIHEDVISEEFNPIDTVICAGDILKYWLDIAYDYAWQNGSDTLVTAEAGTYPFTVINGACIKNSQLSVRLRTRPSMDFPDTLICEIDSILLDFSLPGYDYQINGSNNFGYLSQPGLYRVTADNSICFLEDTFEIKTEQQPMLDLGANIRFCEEESINYTPTYPSNTVFEWADGYLTPNRTFVKEGWYAAKISGERCFTYDTLGVIEIDKPRFSMENQATLCEGDSLLIIPGNPQHVAKWQWSDQSQTDDPTRRFSSPGNFSLIAFNGQCLTKEDISIRYQPNPLFDVENERFACERSAIIYRLDKDPNFFYLFNGEIYNYDSIILTQPGIYPILVNVHGCSFTDSIIANFIAYPESNIPDSVALCRGDSLQITAEPEEDVSYAWSNGITTSSIWIKDEGKYTLVSQRAMCKKYDYLHLRVDDMPQFTGPKTETFCENTIGLSPLYIDHPQFVSWEETEEDSLYPSKAGYCVFNLENLTCKTQDSILVIEQQKPNLNPLSKESCDEELNVFTAGLDSSFAINWGNYAQGPSFSTGDSMQITMYYDNGICTDSIPVASIIHPNPIFDSIAQQAFCEQDEIKISYPLQANQELWWYRGDYSFYGSVLQEAVPENEGSVSYRLELSDLTTKCKSDTTISVHIDQVPTYLLQESYISCDSPLSVDIESNADSIIWRHGASGSILNADSSNWYYFTAYNGLCKVDDSLQVYIIDNPPIELGPDTFLCRGEALTLTAPIAVDWSTGAHSRSITISEEGQYYMTISAMGCSQSDSIYVEKFDLPELSIRDTTVCVGKIYQLPEELEAYDITWYGAKPNQNKELSRAGYYEFFAQGECGDSTYQFTLTYTNCHISIYLPNAFTPNYDGTNELFKPVHDGFFKVRLQIFDRWGEAIFDQTGEDPGWDGTYHSLPVQLGVYNVVFQGYYLDENGKEQVQSELGVVTLVK